MSPRFSGTPSFTSPAPKRSTTVPCLRTFSGPSQQPGAATKTHPDFIMRLTLFDLDHTLLSGDSDVLWCDFLIEQGMLDKKHFAARNADMAVRYQNGTVGLEEVANFYVGMLAGRTAREWEPLRQEFLAEWIVPRIKPTAIALVG